jgi:hypothetical protein
MKSNRTGVPVYFKILSGSVIPFRGPPESRGYFWQKNILNTKKEERVVPQNGYR